MLKNAGSVLKQLLQEPGIQMAPGVYDGISARVVEQAGFRVAYQTGAGVSASVIGQADIGLTTMNDVCGAARAIAMTLNIPLICDVDTGYGNPLNVVRTVHEFEMAGVAAIQMEDQVAPKRCGHLAGKAVIDAREFVQKLKAAVNEKYCSDTLIVARTDARAVYDLDTAIARGKMYMDAGADILFIEAPQTIEEVERIGKTFGGQIPLLSNQVLGGRTPRLSAKELEQLGFKIVIFPDVLPYGASVVLRQMADCMLENGTGYDAIPGGFHTSADLFTTMGMRDWRDLESKYTQE